MKYEVRSAKFEGSTKYEAGETREVAQPDSIEACEDSAFWAWGNEACEELALHDSESSEQRLEPDRKDRTEPCSDASAQGGVGQEGESMTRRPPPDLEERAAKFGEAVIRLARRVPRGAVTDRLIDQLVGAGTSVGANYAEAKDAVSRRDFKNKVGISRKEARESMFFLRMLATAEPELSGEARALWREARELNRIFGAIWRKE